MPARSGRQPAARSWSSWSSSCAAPTVPEMPGPHRDHDPALQLARHGVVLEAVEVEDAGGDMVRRDRHEVAHVPNDVDAAITGVQQQAGDDLVHRVQPKLQLGDDAEVSATTSRPQNRSWFSCSLAVSRLPSAVITSAESRLSTVSPCRRISQPRPPPRVTPATPVAEHCPPVVASPNACVSRSSCAQVSPAGRAPPARRVDSHALHRRHVEHDPAVAHAVAGDVVAAAAHRDRHAVLAGHRQHVPHVGHAGQRAIIAGRRSIAA